MKFTRLIMGCLLTAASLISCKKDKITAPDAPQSANKIAFVYKTDATAAQAFKTLFDANNCSVTLVDKADISSFDFSSYKLIVIGSNTDGTQLVPNWSTADANAIDGSGKPVLLTGIGGLQLGLKLNHVVNYGTCAGNTITSFVVADGGDKVYTSPKSISISTGQSLSMFASGNYAQCFNSSGSAGIKLVGSEMTGSAYYPVAIEANRYGVFGFTAGADAMTASGKDFLVNFVYQLGKF